MECPVKKCKGRMRVTRTVSGKNWVAQERECDCCGIRAAYEVRQYKEALDARTLADRLARSES